MMTPGSTAKESIGALQERWYQQRRIFLVFVLIYQAFCKIGSTAVTILLLRYYKDVIKVENPNVYYGIGISAFKLSALMSVKVSSWYIDKTQNLRGIANIALGFGTLGSFIYSLPLSKWLPILGLLMIGVIESLRISMVAELSKVYGKTTLAKHFGQMILVFALAHILGPTLPLIFDGVEFHIGIFKLNMYNTFTFVFTALLAMLWIACHFFLPNLTLDPQYETLKFEIFKGQPNKTTEDKKEQLLTTMDVLKSGYIALLIFFDVLYCYFYFQTELLLNVVATYDFNWSVKSFAGMQGVCSLIVLPLVVVVQNYILTTPVNIYYLNLYSFIFLPITQSLINLVVAMEINGTILQVLMFGVGASCHAFQFSVAAGTIRWLLFAMSSVKSAYVVESNRYIISECFSFVGYFLTGFVYPYLPYVFPFYNFVCYLVVVILLYHQKRILYKCVAKDNHLD